MANGDEPAPRADGPLSWRDVYLQVGESERRVIAALNTAIQPLALSASDHEKRIRDIEGMGSPQARRAEADVTLLMARVTALELIKNAETAQRKGMVETFGLGKSLVLLGMTIVGCALAVVDTLARMAGA